MQLNPVKASLDCILGCLTIIPYYLFDFPNGQLPWCFIILRALRSKMFHAGNSNSRWCYWQDTFPVNRMPRPPCMPKLCDNNSTFIVNSVSNLPPSLNLFFRKKTRCKRASYCLFANVDGL